MGSIHSQSLILYNTLLLLNPLAYVNAGLSHIIIHQIYTNRRELKKVISQATFSPVNTPWCTGRNKYTLKYIKYVDGLKPWTSYFTHDTWAPFTNFNPILDM